MSRGPPVLQSTVRAPAVPRLAQLPDTGIHTLQTIDDMEDIVAAAFLAVGHDVDACAVLVLDRLERSPVEQPRKLGGSELLSAAVEGKAEAIEQRSAVLPVDIARFRIAAHDRRQNFAFPPRFHWCCSGRTRASSRRPLVLSNSKPSSGEKESAMLSSSAWRASGPASRKRMMPRALSAV